MAQRPNPRRRRRLARKMSLTAAARAEEIAVRECGAAFEVATMRYFREQAKRIGAALGESRKADRTAWDEMEQYLLPNGTVNLAAWNLLDIAQQKILVNKFTGSLLDWAQENITLGKIYDPLWRKAYDVGAKTSQELYGIRAIKRPELVSTAKLQGGKRVVGIGETTRGKISRIVSNGITHGTGTQEMTREIMEEMQTSQKRAKLIAQQETTTSLTAGQYDMMRVGGATTKTWHHRPYGGKGAPRQNHQALNGNTIAIDEKWTFARGDGKGFVSMRFPRDPECGVAGEVIACKCYVTYSGF